MSLLRAARIHGFGPPATIKLEELDFPIAGPGEVLVKMEAAGVGNWDAWVRDGRSWLAHSLPLTLGAEVAGTIASLGQGAPLRFAVGECVYGATNSLFTGGYADYVVCSSDMLATRPEGLTSAEAATLPVAGVTAWQMVVERAEVATGQTVVVRGAAGNVGAFAAQIFVQLVPYKVHCTA